MQECIELHFTSYGVRFTVRVADPLHLPLLTPHFPPGWSISDGVRADHTYTVTASAVDAGPVYTLSLNDAPLLQTPQLAVLVDRFGSDVHHRVAETTDEFLFVHTGVVGWRGRAILLPGRSYAGKSTFVGALVRAGGVYYSDDFALFDDDGVVHPYPKLLAMRVVPGAPRTWQTGDSIGTVGTSPIPVGLMACLRYKPGTTWAIQDLTPAQAMLALFDNTVLAQSRPGDALRIFARATKGLAAVVGTRGEASEAAAELLSLLDDHAAPGVSGE